MFEPGRVGGQRGGVVEILGIRVLDHTSFDVTAPGRIGMVFDSVFPSFIKTTMPRVPEAGHLESRSPTIGKSAPAEAKLPTPSRYWAILGSCQAGGPSANVIFTVRTLPDALRYVTAMLSPG